MRSYGKVSPRIWTGRLGHYMKGRHDLQALVLYLATCPHQNLAGLYRLTTGYIRDDTGHEEGRCSELLMELERFGYLRWDRAAGVIWIIDHARHELGDKASRQQRVAVARLLEDFTISSLVIEFADKYLCYLPDEYPLDRLSERVREAKSIPTRSPSPLPSPSPTTSEGEASASPSLYVEQRTVLSYPCRGNPKQWHLTAEQVGKWKALYPGLDVLGCCRKALAWCEADGRRRKTAKGMPRFLVNWINREVDRGTSRLEDSNGHGSEVRVDLAGRPESDRLCRLLHGQRVGSDPENPKYRDVLALDRLARDVGISEAWAQRLKPPILVREKPPPLCLKCQDAYAHEQHECKPPETP